MIVQLKNDCLTVAISDRGAEMQSVRGADGFGGRVAASDGFFEFLC